ncbi:MAG: recombinase family protein [Clostridia bacterium]|nr:recombinase family protein [Clostridia bacterium]
MKTYGYCRISRKEQNIERQERNIKAEYPDAIILKEAFTGTKVIGRKEFEKLIRTAKRGDIIVFDSVSRMSRNADEGIDLYMKWFDMGVSLVFLKEGYINTSVYASKLQQADISTGKAYLDEGLKVILMGLAEEQIRIAFEQAEKEVADLHHRTSEGIETARLAGKQIGQKTGNRLKVKKESALKSLIAQYSKDFYGNLTDSETMSIINGMDKITIDDGKTEITPHIGLTKDGNQKCRYISRNTYYLYKKELAEELNA